MPPIRPEKFDSRPHVRIDHGLPENRKVSDLSDAAFRLYIEAICLCSRTESNGYISDAQMLRIGRPKVIKELLDSDPEKPLLSKAVKGYEIRDYLQHQRSKDEINQDSLWNSRRSHQMARRETPVRPEVRALQRGARCVLMR